MDEEMAANHAAVVAREEKLKAERVQRLAGKLGIDLTDPKQAFGFVLGCASSATYRLQKQPIVFHMVPSSPICTLIWVLLEHLGLNYQSTIAFEKTTLEMHHPSFLTKFPYHTVPAIEHGSTILHETIAIFEYICKIFPIQAKKRLMGTVRCEDVFAVQDAVKDIRRCVKGGAFLWDLCGFTSRSKEHLCRTFIRCRQDLVAFVEKRARALCSREQALDLDTLHDGGSAPMLKSFLFGDRPSLADLTLAVFLYIFQVGDCFSRLPWYLQEYGLRTAQTFGLSKIVDGKLNGFGIGLQQLVEKRSEELGTLDIAAYESPGVSATSDDSSGGSSSSPSLVVVRELFVDPKRKSTNALLSKVDEADDE